LQFPRQGAVIGGEAKNGIKLVFFDAPNESADFLSAESTDIGSLLDGEPSIRNESWLFFTHLFYPRSSHTGDSGDEISASIVTNGVSF